MPHSPVCKETHLEFEKTRFNTMCLWTPAGFYSGVGKLDGLELPSPSRVRKLSPDADECFEKNAYIIRILSVLPSLSMHQNTFKLFFRGGGGQCPLAHVCGRP